MLMKKKILKSIAHSNKIPLNIRKFSEMEKSIYIDIPNTEEGTRVTLSEEVGDMAFEDIIVTRDSVIVTNGVDVTIPNGALLHIFRLSSESIGIGFHLLDRGGLSKYILLTAYEFNYRTMVSKIAWCPPSHRQHAEEGLEQAIADALKILETLRNYERVAKETPKVHSIMKLPKAIRDTYVEYVVDLSKPVIRSSVSGGGSHASPREHLRRGHYRTRNGVKYFVRSTVVNEGSKGKVDKEYKV